MEVIVEIIIQFIVEIVIEAVGEILFEFGFETLVDTADWTRKTNSPFATIGYFIFGLIFGLISYLIFSEPIIANTFAKIIYFLVSPILLGFSLCLFSWLRKRQTMGEKFFKLAKFVDGFVFAVGYSAARFVLTHYGN